MEPENPLTRRHWLWARQQMTRVLRQLLDDKWFKKSFSKALTSGLRDWESAWNGFHADANASSKATRRWKVLAGVTGLGDGRRLRQLSKGQRKMFALEKLMYFRIHHSALLSSLVLCGLSACAPVASSNPDAGSARDAGSSPRDSGIGGQDAGPAIDAGLPDGGPEDAGSERDGGSVEDAGQNDGGGDAGSSEDAGAVDAGLIDAGIHDAGSPEDAGPGDAGSPEDAGPGDAGSSDAGLPDGGLPLDAGSTIPDAGDDAGTMGVSDAGPTGFDAGVDAGSASIADAGPTGFDAGVDAGSASIADAGPTGPDAGVDAGTTGVTDAGPVDGGCVPSTTQCVGNVVQSCDLSGVWEDVACTPPANSTSICAAGGTCGYSCTSPFKDCDGYAGNGCESNSNTDPKNCGGCNNPCATGTCINGTCSALSFGSVASVASGATLFGTVFVATGDFNGDHNLDLAVARQGSTNDVLIFQGNGNGTFQPPASYSVGGVPEMFVVSDVNSDGKQDLLVAADTSGVSVILGFGDGGFEAPVLVPTVGAATSLCLGDLNNDHLPDFVVMTSGGTGTDGGTDNVEAFVNTGDGGAFAPSWESLVWYGFGYDGIPAVADYNLDGNADLAVITSGDFHVALGNGDGTFGDLVDAGPNGGPGDPGAPKGGPYDNFVVSDFNLDGYPDLVATGGETLVYLYLNNADGEGTFMAPPDWFDLSSWNNATEYFSSVADFNGDGIPDLAVGDKYEPSTFILAGYGDGTFAAPFGAITDVENVIIVIPGDFNNDGKPDIVSLKSSGSDSFLLVITLNTTPY